MAKKTKITDVQNSEPVTNCDQSLEPVANCDHLDEVDANCDHPEKGEVVLSQHDIEKLIFTVRGEQVLIDRDLAYVYQVEVKQMNRQVKRNIERFPEDFMFQLTKDEYNSLKCQNGTSNKRGGDHRALPYAFTQQGVGMLSGLLRSQIAIETNIKIMRAFVAMRRFIVHNAGIMMRISHLEQHQMETDGKIDLILDKMEEIAPKQLPEQIFRTGCVEKNHDRFLIIDDKVYLMGASLKDMGAGLCAVTRMQASPEAVLGLLK